MKKNPATNNTQLFRGANHINVPFLHTILKSILHKKKTTCIINCGEKHYASFRTISFYHINNKA